LPEADVMWWANGRLLLRVGRKVARVFNLCVGWGMNRLENLFYVSESRQECLLHFSRRHDFIER
jgi:hypothetical protein